MEYPLSMMTMIAHLFGIVGSIVKARMCPDIVPASSCVHAHINVCSFKRKLISRFFHIWVFVSCPKTRTT